MEFSLNELLRAFFENEVLRKLIRSLLSSGKSKLFRKVQNITLKTNGFVVFEAEKGGSIAVFGILEGAV